MTDTPTRWRSRAQHLHWMAAGDQLPEWTPDWLLNLWPDRLLQRLVCWRYGHDLDTDSAVPDAFCIWCQKVDR